MKSKSFRMFEANGNMCQFNTEGFRNAITQYQMKLKDEGKPYLLREISEQIAVKLTISPEALSNWRKGYNGPSDLERIKEIAAVLNCNYEDLLRTPGGHKHMISRQVSDEVMTSEKEALRSIINDLLEIVENYGKTKGFDDWSAVDSIGSGEDSEENLEEWFEAIRIKMRKNEYNISRENVKKLENLFFETKCFVDYSYHGVYRWTQICKGFSLQWQLQDVVDDWAIDVDTILINEGYLDEDMKEYFHQELDSYINGRISYDPPIEVLGYKIGAWYMEVVRNDFPELFVD